MSVSPEENKWIDQFHVGQYAFKGAFLLKAKQLFYWEVNFVYFLNLLPAANDTENVNEVSRVNVVS